MKQLVLCLTLLLSGLCFAQQQGQPPPDAQQPPYGTPPTFPGEPQAPGQQPTRPMPPDEQVSPPEAMSTQEVQRQITSHLGSEPELDHTNVVAQVSDSSVVLTGNVRSEEQHDLALRIAQSYAGDRQVVDKIKVQQQT
jgi:BON domain-containing protein